MEKKLIIFDTTLRDGEQSPGCSMHLKDKLDMAEALELLGVDVIEVGFPASSTEDYSSCVAVSKILKKASIAALCRCNKDDIKKAYEAIKDAVKPRLHVFIATSDIHLKSKLHISKSDCLQLIDEHTKYAKSLTDDVEFSFEDASRTDIDFLIKATLTAVKAGAKTINFPDTVGYKFPSEMKDMISQIKKSVPSDVVISAHCHNDLGLAVANSIAAIEGGANQIECTINGIGERAGNAALEEIIMALKIKNYDISHNIDISKIYKTSRLLSSIIGRKIPPNKPIVGSSVYIHESGIHQHGILQDKATYQIINPEDVGIFENSIVLGKHSGRHAFLDLVSDMGYVLDENAISTYFEKYKALAEKKQEITRKDIDAILVGNTKRPIKRLFKLLDYEITAYASSSHATITLECNGKKITERMTGDGPIDAAFKAILNITGENFKLLDYNVNSITEGKDALGEAIVRLCLNNKTLSGKGISTDVLEASILAYLDAANKLIEVEYED